MASVFFFSRRRRHTRSPRDWSSDVCSSDLVDAQVIVGGRVKISELPLVLLTASRAQQATERPSDRKSTRLNSSHEWISYAVFCLKKKTASHRHGPRG